MTREEYNRIKDSVLPFFENAHIILTEHEKDNLEVADFGLNTFEIVGLSIITYVNTERCCAKEMVLLPNQICPEHTHVSIPELNYSGKEETFRCRYGCVYLYVEENKKIVLLPGEQYTLQPNSKHWFQAGSEGAVISEFSTKSIDEYDVFTDSNVKRIPYIE